MAVFTIEFHEALELDPSIETDIMAHYPIFDEAYRPHLNEQIKMHFHNREIGMENISMFKLAFKRLLALKMPLYNQHYNLSRIKFDPLQTMNIKTVAAGESLSANQGVQENTSTSDAASEGRSYNFPQQQMNGLGDYASEGSDSKSQTAGSAKASEESNTKTNDKSDSETVGSQGHAAMLIFQYRQTLVNVDEMVLQELEDLFMKLWGTTDDFYNNQEGPFTHGTHYFGLSI